METRLMDCKSLMQYLGLSKHMALRFGAEANARIVYGRRVLYDRAKIDAYIDLLEVNNENAD